MAGVEGPGQAAAEAPEEAQPLPLAQLPQGLLEHHLIPCLSPWDRAQLRATCKRLQEAVDRQAGPQLSALLWTPEEPEDAAGEDMAPLAFADKQSMDGVHSLCKLLGKTPGVTQLTLTLSNQRPHPRFRHRAPRPKPLVSAVSLGPVVQQLLAAAPQRLSHLSLRITGLQVVWAPAMLTVVGRAASSTQQPLTHLSFDFLAWDFVMLDDASEEDWVQAVAELPPGLQHFGISVALPADPYEDDRNEGAEHLTAFTRHLCTQLLPRLLHHCPGLASLSVGVQGRAVRCAFDLGCLLGDAEAGAAAAAATVGESAGGAAAAAAGGGAAGGEAAGGHATAPCALRHLRLKAPRIRLARRQQLPALRLLLQQLHSLELDHGARLEAGRRDVQGDILFACSSMTKLRLVGWMGAHGRGPGDDEGDDAWGDDDAYDYEDDDDGYDDEYGPEGAEEEGSEEGAEEAQLQQQEAERVALIEQGTAAGLPVPSVEASEQAMLCAADWAALSSLWRSIQELEVDFGFMACLVQTYPDGPPTVAAASPGEDPLPLTLPGLRRLMLCGMASPGVLAKLLGQGWVEPGCAVQVDACHALAMEESSEAFQADLAAAKAHPGGVSFVHRRLDGSLHAWPCTLGVDAEAPDMGVDAASRELQQLGLGDMLRAAFDLPEALERVSQLPTDGLHGLAFSGASGSPVASFFSGAGDAKAKEGAKAEARALKGLLPLHPLFVYLKRTDKLTALTRAVLRLYEEEGAAAAAAEGGEGGEGRKGSAFGALKELVVVDALPSGEVHLDGSMERGKLKELAILLLGHGVSVTFVPSTDSVCAFGLAGYKQCADELHESGPEVVTPWSLEAEDRGVEVGRVRVLV